MLWGQPIRWSVEAVNSSDSATRTGSEMGGPDVERAMATGPVDEEVRNGSDL